MSTKTAFKRIALGAVAAMGFGLLSIVPASAALSGGTNVVTLTASGSAGTSAEATVAGVIATPLTLTITSTFVGVTAANTVTVLPVLTKPAGSAVTVAGSTCAQATSTGITSQAFTACSDLITIAGTSGEANSTLIFTPDVSGVYVFSVALSGSNVTTAGQITVTVPKVAGTATSIAVAKTTENPSGTALAAGKYVAAPVLDALQVSSITVIAGTTVKILTTSIGGTFKVDDEIRVSMRGFGTIHAFTAADATADGAESNNSVFTATTVPGTYTLEVTLAKAGTSDTTTDLITSITMIVIGPTGYSHVLSTSVVDFPDDSNNAAADEEIRVSKTATTDTAQIMVTLLNTSAAAFNGAILSVSIAGPGLVDAATSGTYTDALNRADSVTLTSANVGYINVTADGTAGTGTITIAVVDSTTFEVMGTFTETVYFYGTVATLTATANSSIAKASATARGCSHATTCTYLAFGTTPFVTIIAKDSGGNLVPAASLANPVSALIADTLVIAQSTVTAVTAKATASTAGVSTDPYGLGYLNADISGRVGATSGSSRTITYRTLLSNGVTYVSAAPLTFTIGGSIAKEVITIDKTSYEPGEGMVVVVTATDSAGNPTHDGNTAPTLTGNKSLGGAIAFGVYQAGKVSTANANQKHTVFAPATSGNFSINGLGGDAAGTLLTVTGTVNADPAAQAAVDAGLEATDAANAATDAADAAAEAADAATAAAEDATDAADAATAAVAALSAQIATLIAGLKARITSLTSLLVKIQKKVKA